MEAAHILQREPSCGTPVLLPAQISDNGNCRSFLTQNNRTASQCFLFDRKIKVPGVSGDPISLGNLDTLVSLTRKRLCLIKKLRLRFLSWAVRKTDASEFAITSPEYGSATLRYPSRLTGLPPRSDIMLTIIGERLRSTSVWSARKSTPRRLS